MVLTVLGSVFSYLQILPNFHLTICLVLTHASAVNELLNQLFFFLVKTTESALVATEIKRLLSSSLMIFRMGNFTK